MANCESLDEGAKEQFWLCTICLQQFKEPKQLPCFHRYCRECLKQLLERHRGASVVSCPECRDEFTVPIEGIDGFKTDLYMINMIENIKMRKSIEDNERRECYACLKTLKMAAYCSKCKGFLCHSCYVYHMTNNTLRDHRAHVIGLKDQNLTLEKLGALQEPPKCQSHPEVFCQLCCKTCCNLPICVHCINGCHRNHDISDVSALAVEEARRLDQELKILDQRKEKLNEMSEKVDEIRNDLILDVSEKKRNYQTDYDSDVGKFRKELKAREYHYEMRKTAVKEMYDKLFEEIKREAEDEFKKLEQEYNEELESSHAKLQIMDCDRKDFMKNIQKRLEERLSGFDDTSQRIVDAAKRYENIAETARSVLKTKHLWTSVQCIPVICDSIRVETGRRIPELETPTCIECKFKVKEDDKVLADIEEISGQNGWFITGMTRCYDENVAISGPTSESFQSHITLINTEGKVLRQEKLKASVRWAYRVCAYLSQFVVSTVCWPNEIGLYNVGDGSYIKRNIPGIVGNWPVRRYVRCLATDIVRNRILVGAYDSRDVYVFDDHLNICSITSLPDVMEYPWNIAVTEDKLLVCDFLGQRAYILSMAGSKGKILHELLSPAVEGCEWRPFSLCTERNGSIYVLWEGKVSDEWKCFLVQYSKTGDQLPAVIPLYQHDARCVTTTESNNREQVVVATLKSGKLITYNLVSVCV
ncbi:E3 ubiquitin-protein ligase TRIM56 [Holothuria leucospilota]|uniref:E3 ubiquitin-protein ligase TRIM56 n=1 Tax=Holothuria leucospilota TaxID=206669 RepID=A0A9Q0YIR2_HOLLE|nr:E3 ubiquitin-protein ligase TRIM56 [Holothuria leucospilota]